MFCFIFEFFKKQNPNDKDMLLLGYSRHLALFLYQNIEVKYNNYSPC